ncbi:MAG: ABC transporter, partial [Candidatus Poribacteria bacterium]|nr:ABC transporter [Candidatus Poribacteria bacterium]
MIRVSHLTKKYGTSIAVDDISFEVPAGEIVGYLG